MTSPHRPRDYDDVIQLVRVNHLPEDLPVDPYVAEKYREMWRNAQVSEER